MRPPNDRETLSGCLIYGTALVAAGYCVSGAWYGALLARAPLLLPLLLLAAFGRHIMRPFWWPLASDWMAYASLKALGVPRGYIIALLAFAWVSTLLIVRRVPTALPLLLSLHTNLGATAVALHTLYRSW